MITCKVGNTIINCFDEEYDKYKLKIWSNENRLICPDCGKPYEYCHGEIVSPYFRHKEKSLDCDEIYKEPEIDEHIKGKTTLYKWLLSISDECNLENIHLEHYIKETRQKPDIYFEQNGERYAIEYQCTPIATEFLKRRELYKLAGINDIWILGCDKYTDGKIIEKHVGIKFNIKTNQFIFNNINGLLTHSRFLSYIPNVYETKDLLFKNGFFNVDKYITDAIRNKYVENLIESLVSRNKLRATQERKRLFYKSIEEVVNAMKHIEINSKELNGFVVEKISLSSKSHINSPYDFRIDFAGAQNDPYTVFIKNEIKKCDLCIYEPDKYRMYKNIDTFQYSDNYDLQDKLFDMIVKAISKSIEIRQSVRLRNVLNRNKSKIERCIFQMTGLNASIYVWFNEIDITHYQCGLDVSLDSEKILYGKDGKVLENYCDFEVRLKDELQKYIKNQYSKDNLIKLIDGYNGLNICPHTRIEVRRDDSNALMRFAKRNNKYVGFKISIEIDDMIINYEYAGVSNIVKCNDFKMMFYIINYLVNRFKHVCE